MSRKGESKNESGDLVEFEDAIQASCEKFDDIACVYVDHPRIHEGKYTALHFRIFVYTEEAEGLGDPISIHHLGDRIVIESTNGEQRHLTFSAIATFTDPNLSEKDMGGMPVFIAKGVEGAEPISLEDGIEHLRKKLTDPSYISSLPEN